LLQRIAKTCARTGEDIEQVPARNTCPVSHLSGIEIRLVKMLMQDSVQLVVQRNLVPGIHTGTFLRQEYH